LLPLQRGLRRFMPRGTQRAHAVAAGLVLPRQLAGVPVKPHQHSYLYKWAFWVLFAVAVGLSYFWPFGTPPRDSSRLRE
jgi:hypothetical protein